MRRHAFKSTTRLRLRPPNTRDISPAAGTRQRQRRAITDYASSFQIGLLATLTTLSLLTGWWLYPEADADPVLPGKLVIEVPPTTVDASDVPITLRDVLVEEVHAENDPVPVTDAMAEQPAPAGSTVRLRISVSYMGPQIADAPITFIVDLPAAAEFMGCTPKAEDHLNCTPSAATPNNMVAENEKRVTITGVLRSDTDDPSPMKHRSVSALMDLGGMPGITFASSRTRIAASLPNVVFTALPRDSSFLQYLPVKAFPEQNPGIYYLAGTQPQFNTFTNIFTSRPEEVRWAEPPDATGGNMPSLVGWIEGPQAPPGASQHHLPITGVREGVIRKDTEKTFWSGIALGVAGAGAMALLQEVLSALLDLEDRRR